MFDLNVPPPCGMRCARWCRQLVAQGDNFIAGFASRRPVWTGAAPGTALYGAAQAAVSHLFHSLEAELRDDAGAVGDDPPMNGVDTPANRRDGHAPVRPGALHRSGRHRRGAAVLPPPARRAARHLELAIYLAGRMSGPSGRQQQRQRRQRRRERAPGPAIASTAQRHRIQAGSRRFRHRLQGSATATAGKWWRSDAQRRRRARQERACAASCARPKQWT